MGDYTVGHIDHIGLPLPNEKIDKVKDFYTRIMKFECTFDSTAPNGSRMVFLVNGETRFELYTGEERDGLRGMFDHMCIYCTNIDALAEAIKNEGYVVEEPIKRFKEDGSLNYALQFYIGPAGEYVELYEKNF